MKIDWQGWAKIAVPFILAGGGYLWNTSIQTATLAAKFESMERNVQTQIVLMQRDVERLKDAAFSGR